MSGFYAAKNNVLSRTNGLERGKWLRYNLPMLKRERIPLPAGREVMTHGESALRLCRSAFWRLWSSPLGQATMGRMRHRLHGRRVTGEASPSRPGPDVAGPPPTEEARSPAVSIIMATHNRASTLDRAITSVQRQTMSDWELIVVDDGSTDSSAELLRQLADPRIRVITHERNRGVCAAKNTGLDAMRGEWFTTLDSDDEIVPEALEAMLACAARTGATAITCNCRDAETGLLTGRGPGSDCRLSPEATARCRGEFWGLTRSELLGELRFDERLPGYEETVFLLINREARRFYLHEALRVYHTEGSDRVTKASGASSLAQKVDVHVALGEDHDYLCELGRVDFAAFARTYARIVIARCLRPFIGVHRRGSLPAR